MHRHRRFPPLKSKRDIDSELEIIIIRKIRILNITITITIRRRKRNERDHKSLATVRFTICYIPNIFMFSIQNI